MSGLSSVTNIVVLMFENRSFDNIFGTLYPLTYKNNGYTFDGVTPGTTVSDTAPWTDAGTEPVWNDEAITTPNPDPGEIFQDVNMQLFGSTQAGPPWPSASSLGTPPMSGFVSNYTIQTDPDGRLFGDTIPRTRTWGPPGYGGKGTDAVGSDIMHYFNSAQLPVSSGLAKQYAVCDQWFCSVPTQTFPNRMFAHCATTWSYGAFLKQFSQYLDDFDMIALTSFTNSIFAELDVQGSAGKLPNATAPYWKVYYPKNAGSYSISAALLQYVEQSSQLVDISELATDAANGTLPLYSFIEPPYGFPNPAISDIPMDSSYHPPYDVLQGEQFLQQIYETLFTPANNPAWATTLLIVTFDEHGGTYDHVPPPEAPLPSAAAYPVSGQPVSQVPANPSGPPFDRYGVRVPTILISSQIAPGTIFRATNPDSTPVAYLDHTSIIRTVFDWLFTPGSISLTNRDANAPNVAGVLTEATGTNTGVTFSITWPPKITYSPEEIAALRASDHLTLAGEEYRKRRQE